LAVNNKLDWLSRQLNEWINSTEGEHFEFKEAKQQFSFDKLAEYCCALANEGGGKVILGITDKRPRKIVGTKAFPQLERTRRSLMEKIPLRIEVFEIFHSGKRVIVFEVPTRPIGVPIKYEGIYWSREADSVVPLSEERLRAIFAEAGLDFSADICHGATMQDLDTGAIEDFRRRWIEKSKNPGLAPLSDEQLLRDAEILRDDDILRRQRLFSNTALPTRPVPPSSGWSIGRDSFFIMTSYGIPSTCAMIFNIIRTVFSFWTFPLSKSARCARPF